jgi:streptogramin lyase
LLAACTTTTTSGGATTSNTPQTGLTPAISAVGSFAEYPLPQAESGLMRPAIDHQGRIWFGEMGHNYLAFFNPHTNTFRQMIPPRGAFGIMGIAVASDDTIWFAEQYANYIGHYNPTTNQYMLYNLPMLKTPDPSNPNNTLTLPSAPNDLIIDSHSDVWFTELNADSIGMLNTRIGKITQYPFTPNKSVQKLNPYGIAIDTHGMIWFSEASSNRLGHLDPTSGKVVYFTVPGTANPLMEVVSDAHGVIWATTFNSGQLVRFDPRTQQFTSYYAPSTSGNVGGLYGLTIPQDGSLWVTVSTENTIARLDTTAQHFVYYSIPTPDSLPLGIVEGPQHTLWFTEAGTNKIGMLQA